jgi:hypothetical protein
MRVLLLLAMGIPLVAQTRGAFAAAHEGTLEARLP